jgi:hypothetical protein
MEIKQYYKDEEVPVIIHIQDKDGVPVVNAADLSVYIVLSATKGGNALDGVDYQMAMIDQNDAIFQKVLSPAELTSVTENLTFYYTIWSREVGKPPVHRDAGTILLQESISLVS